MAITGFDPKWKDFPDYIIGITREIWEDRNIHTLHHYYAKDIVVRSPGSVVVGNAGVIGATMATLAEFPDRQLLGRDVIWCEHSDGSLLSSHRIVSTATHTGSGMYGNATGVSLRYRIIADCAARANVIDDEWLIRDQGAIVRQMGWDPQVFARDLIAREGGPEHCVRPFTPDNDQAGPYKGQGNDHEAGQRYADILNRIMQADMAAIPTEYDRACYLELPGGNDSIGHAEADKFWMGLRAAFPSATFTIHHCMGCSDDGLPNRAAIRWSLHGKHDGWGSFGQPTGANVYVLGISHAEFGPWGLRFESTVIDDTAIWKQIELQAG